ncbi:MAG: hypothetical protein HY865_12625 [Chloroflexi bacterium]|nr:hypothetical protein [Chloroflexota bacterium]
MEIMLAIVVVAAMIFFGALISMGNERQRRAIDNLREQVVQWSIQDLRIKHEKLSRDIYIDDPLGWLNKVAGKSCGRNLSLQVIESFEFPRVLLCATDNGDEKIIFTPHSPGEIRSMKRAKQNRLDKFIDQNPLLSLPRGAIRYECSVLNNGLAFDLELPLAWKELTGIDGGEMNIIWIYFVS